MMQRHVRLFLGIAILTATCSLAAQSAADNTADAERVEKALHVAAGSTVCEIGAGSGELTVLMARTVGPGGHVYSNDLNADRRKEIGQAADGAGVKNITIVEGQPAAANIAPGTCDALFMRNVYHHFADPAAMNASLFAALKAGARIAVIDFAPRGEESPDPKGRADEAHHGVSSASVIRELRQAGFVELTSEPTPRGAFMVTGVKPQ